MTIPIRRLVILLCVIIIAYGIFRPRTYKYQFESSDLMAGNLEGTIAKLIACESSGNIHAIHAHDGKDGKDSVGVLQFKLATFVQYAKALNVFPEADAAELPNLWTGPDEQIKLAKEMIKKDRKNLHHWDTCSKKYHLI
jgi:hypothetical protein